MKLKWILFWLGAAAMAVLWLATPSLAEAYIKSRPEGAVGATGPLGDTFGSLTSFFSVVTTVLLVAGLMLQREEIAELRAQSDAERARQKRKHWPLLGLTMMTCGNAGLVNGLYLYRIKLRLHNVGATAGDISIIFPSQAKTQFSIIQPLPVMDLQTGNDASFEFECKSPTNDNEFLVTFGFVTLEGDQGSVLFEYKNLAFTRNNDSCSLQATMKELHQNRAKVISSFNIPES